MKKLLFLLIIISMTIPAFAKLQLDLDVHVPYYTSGTFQDQSISDTMKNVFIVPEAKLNYFIGPKFLKVGIGIKAYTMVIQSFAFPIVSLESQLGPFVLNTNAGGGIYSLFGFVNSFETSKLLVGEASIAYKIGIISFGTGMTVLSSQELLKSNAAIYMGTVFARFTF